MTRVQRRDLQREVFPSIEQLVDDEDATAAWKHATRRWMRPTNNPDEEIEVLAWILQDILRHDQAAPGRSGPKPSALDPKRAWELLRQFAGIDHTTLDFANAFAILAGARSIRHLATLTGLSKSKVARLLHGERPPTLDEVSAVAAGFRKHPSFFREYRNSHLAEALHDHLAALPEASIDMYRQSVTGGRRK